MIGDLPSLREFKKRLRGCMPEAAEGFRRVNIPPRRNVYHQGDDASAVYLIDWGRIKTVSLSLDGKECLLAIYGKGDLFGEVSLAGPSKRLESATAMEQTIVMRMECDAFHSCLKENALVMEFVRYLAIRIAEQQQTIANLATADSEHR